VKADERDLRDVHGSQPIEHRGRLLNLLAAWRHGALAISDTLYGTPGSLVAPFDPPENRRKGPKKVFLASTTTPSSDLLIFLIFFPSPLVSL
jgi:hypothetical protein